MGHEDSCEAPIQRNEMNEIEEWKFYKLTDVNKETGVRN